MAVSGPKPKSFVRSRVRDARVHDWTEVVDRPFVGAPSLPSRRPNGEAWPPWTRRWWAKVARMPHCRLWAPSDWEFAFDTAALKAEFHERGNAAMAAELRNREKVLGTTTEYRRDLRIRYVPAPPVAVPKEVTSLDDYREL